MDEDNLGVCIACVEFCHKGHELVQANYGQPIRSICDCGAGKFDGCSKLNDKNIFIEVVNERILADKEKNFKNHKAAMLEKQK